MEMIERLDNLNIQEYVLDRYAAGYDRSEYNQLLEELRIAQHYGMTHVEWNHIHYEAENWDMVKMYIHNIFCDCKMGMHYDNLVWNVGWVGSLHIEHEKLTGKRFKEANR